MQGSFLWFFRAARLSGKALGKYAHQFFWSNCQESENLLQKAELFFALNRLAVPSVVQINKFIVPQNILAYSRFTMPLKEPWNGGRGKNWRDTACATPLHLKLNISCQGPFLALSPNPGRYKNPGGRLCRFSLCSETVCMVLRPENRRWRKLRPKTPRNRHSQYGSNGCGLSLQAHTTLTASIHGAFDRKRYFAPNFYNMTRKWASLTTTPICSLLYPH